MEKVDNMKAHMNNVSRNSKKESKRNARGKINCETKINIKTIFHGLISRLNTFEERTSEHEDM